MPGRAHAGEGPLPLPGRAPALPLPAAAAGASSSSSSSRAMALPWRQRLVLLGAQASRPRLRTGTGRCCSGNVGLQENSPDSQGVLEVANINKLATEERIVLPRKKTWDKLAVLQTLASTVHRDPTASQAVFQDDPYLIPRTSTEFRLFFLSKESGKNAAKYIFNTHPKYFAKDIAEPHIPCLMPENLELQLEEVSEAALKERIQLRKVNSAVDMYDQLQQAGASVSLETSNSLLDLLCFYGDREPVQANPSTDSRELEEQQEERVEVRKKRGSTWRTSDTAYITWRENNNAERVLSLMPEKNAHSYCTVIRGMVKHRAYAKAFDTYTDLLNNRLKGDVYTFNALISSAVEVKEKFEERWDLAEGLLREMAQQDVQPNLLTFNAVLKVLGHCGSLGRSVALSVLGEMSALHIEPSLATYDHLLGIFYKSAYSRGPTDIIYEVMDEIEGKSFYPQDPADANFFSNTMRICLDLKDVQLAYQLHRVVETGENWKMLGDMSKQTAYCGRFFTLLCMMEHLDVVLKWYKELVPSMFYPNTEGLLDLLQALDMGSRLDMIPQIWKDIKQLGQGHKPVIVEAVLSLMASESHSPEIQVAFADCAADIYEVQERGRIPLEWTATSLGNCTLLFARVGRTQEMWRMLQHFKKHNRVPSDLVMDEVLNCIKQSNDADQALNLVKLAADFSLQSTSNLAEKVLKEFQLSEEQRSALDDLVPLSSSSSSE
ncbi:small ribosomal subunit protein mS39 [Paroedura picta]|uniref:small ribosomal subunit protein mS39 n=1 Tax=Paroedura picta TaxID=143630 RepID=UPI00405735E3